MSLVNSGRNYLAGAIIAAPATLFNAANAHIGVGNGVSATTTGMTDLTGTSKARQIVDTAPGIATNVLTFVATFGTGAANFAWEEWGVFNASTAGIMLNRVQEDPSLGTKTVAQSWEITATLTVNAA